MAKRNVGIEIPSFLNMDKPPTIEKRKNNLKIKPKKNNKKNKKTKKHVGKKTKIILGFIVIIGTTAFLLLSPLFNLYEINIENNQKFSRDEIKNIAQIPLRW